MNLGNCWEAPPPYSWGIRYTTEDIDRIAAEGFDHIRVPVAWHFHMKPGANGPEIDPALLADLEPVLRRALEKNLHVLLDWHHFHDLTDHPAANRARFIASWETIARHFKSWPPGLFLELLNEPRDALTTEVANPIYAETIAAIRRIDPQRIILVSPGKWGDIRELEKLRLPDGDDRIIVTVHCYEPFYFTHQGAGWVQLKPLAGSRLSGTAADPFVVPGFPQGEHRRPQLHPGLQHAPRRSEPLLRETRAGTPGPRTRLVRPFRPAGASRRIRQPPHRRPGQQDALCQRRREPSPKPAESRGRCGNGKPDSATGTPKTTARCSETACLIDRMNSCGFRWKA